ncbi:MAG: ASCH domain-containing protein [Anaerolineae bacterium]
MAESDLAVQPVDKPILCSPYVEPTEHWVYDREAGTATRVPGRRPASYWFKSQRVASQQLAMFAEEQREDLPLVNALREDVKRWRQSGYEGATPITKELLRAWGREDRPRRLFFCQIEAAETVIFLNEILLSGRTPRFRPRVSEVDLRSLSDSPADPALAPLTRLGLKMATGSGKTVVMAMLIAWAFCNRARVPSDERFPSAVLVVCPNLTIKERLQVLRPEDAGNYYAAFDLVPAMLRPLMGQGKVLVTNWHVFAPESEHSEGGTTYRVVDKGPESAQAFARRVLGDLATRGPVLVLNDEGHHAWRPPLANGADGETLGQEEKAELEEATVWIDGLDKINGAVGIRCCVDLSATPFYIAGSGHTEGSPFPWLVSDFGLVDAIESGIVKIPRLPVSDVTGRPEPKYFRLWHNITANLQPGQKLPGKAGKPKPEVVYTEAEPALLMLAGQWVQRFDQIQAANDAQDKTPPVLIIVCDNTDIAEVFYRNISGEQEVEVVAPDADDADDEDGDETPRRKTKKPKKATSYGQGRVFPDYFSNRSGFTPTIRIDSKLLAQAESGDPTVSRGEAAELLREIVATVGKKGQPGEHVRCVVSVAMLTEGWDASNVTHILGLRAFGSQLLCEQVVGRGLRRMDYTPDPTTGLLTEEYVDIYGVPFSLIPYKGRPTNAPAPPADKPKNHVRALPERAAFEMQFPIVEGYAFALRRNIITADIDAMEPLRIEPEYEPTAVFVKPRVGYEIGAPSQAGPGEAELQDRAAYYASTHLQTIEFEIARQVVVGLVGDEHTSPNPDSNPKLRLQSRHQLFPQVYRLVHAYVERKVDFRGENPCELGQEKYLRRVVERLLAAIRPDEGQGEPPLMPLLNRYKPIGTTSDVDFLTVQPCVGTMRSHINLVAADTQTWEQMAAFRLEQAAQHGIVKFYARNDGLDFVIPYEYLGVSHVYEPDYLVRLSNDVTLILEIKGQEKDQDRAKHEAAGRWVQAVNNWGKLGRWDFHVTHDPQMLEKELRDTVASVPHVAVTNAQPANADVDAAPQSQEEDVMRYDKLPATLTVLTVRQPWASLIVTGQKTEEYRSWPTKYRGPLVIHSSGTFTRADREDAEEYCAQAGLTLPKDLPLGRFVGIVTVTDCYEYETEDSDRGFAWVLTNPAIFEVNTPWEGHLNLWHIPAADIAESLHSMRAVPPPKSPPHR